MSEELKPCPFCGKNTGYIKKIVVSIDWIIYTSYCENRLCEASLGANNRTYDTSEEAEAAWNTRPLEDALQARVDALEAALVDKDKHIEYLTRLLMDWTLYWQCDLIAANGNGVGAFGVDEGQISTRKLIDDLIERTTKQLEEVKE